MCVDKRKREGPKALFFSASTHISRLATFSSAFTTPPLTRKRKALEAAIDDDKSSAATETLNTGRKSLKKAARSDETEDSRQISPSGASASYPVSLRKRVSDIATPATTTGSMESDDDFMTDVSSHEEDGMGTQGSDDESIGEGTLWLSDDF